MKIKNYQEGRQSFGWSRKDYVTNPGNLLAGHAKFKCQAQVISWLVLQILRDKPKDCLVTLGFFKNCSGYKKNNRAK